MTISLPAETILDQDYVSTADIPSKRYTPHPGATGFRISIFATTTGTLEIDEFNLDGVPQPVKINIPILANDKRVENFIFTSVGLRARFQPNSEPGSVRIEAMYYGHTAAGA